ncbi:hypothetical protein Lal_00001068 [Lupinus albus]|nr:hypothetical protein Lal_00001068 [Lupinus albus]
MVAHLTHLAYLPCRLQGALPAFAVRDLILRLVSRLDAFSSLTPAMDRDRTVSRRSEPSSRTTLMGEQPNPWTYFSPRM